jgi:hypothetical protein
MAGFAGTAAAADRIAGRIAGRVKLMDRFLRVRGDLRTTRSISGPATP